MTRFLGQYHLCVQIFILSMISTAAWADDPKYPDGLNGQLPVIQRISLTSPYAVPAGSNLYIVNVAASNQNCNRLPFSCYLTATGVTNLLDSYFDQRGSPIIVGPRTVIASTSSAITFDINGFLVPATVTAVLTDLAPSAGYTVPAGMNLYLMRMGTVFNAVSPIRLAVGGVQISVSHSEPVLIGSGQTISNLGGTTVTLIGYLKPQ